MTDIKGYRYAPSLVDWKEPPYPPEIQKVDIIQEAPFGGAFTKQPPKQLKGHWQNSWVDIMYNRIILIPDRIDGGNLVDDAKYEVSLYAPFKYVQELNLTSVHWGDKSIEVAGKLSGKINTFNYEKYQVTLLAKGESPTIDDKVVWLFHELSNDAAILPVTATRSFLFHYKGQNTTEKFEWLTDVLRSSTRENRLSLRNTSRQVYSMQVVLVGQSQHDFVERLNTLYGLNWTVPLWHEGTRTNREVSKGDKVLYMNTTLTTLKWTGQVAILSDSGQAVSLTISKVYDDRVELKNPLEIDMGIPRVFPCRSGVAISGIKSDVRSSHTVVTVEWTIQNPVLTESIPPATVRGLEVLDYKSTVSQQSGQQKLDIYDPKVAKPVRYAQRVEPDRSYSVDIIATNRAESFQTRLLIDRLRGRYSEVYLPTWRNELSLYTDVPQGSTTMDVIWGSYSSFEKQVDTLLIRTPKGTQYLQVRTVEAKEGFLRLSLIEAVKWDISVNEPTEFCQMMKVRPVEDKVEVNHGPYSSSVTTINFIEVAK